MDRRTAPPRSKHWAYLKPQLAPTHEVTNRNWPVNWIDHFILSKLEEQNLTPAAEADKITLIRRLSFDLTGLPPTPQEVKQFVKNQSPQAYETLVDRLLASPHYGERMAIYWLDLVRFADTVGYHGDQDHHISPYRDYVIRAFNENMPFDQFTREQLAGDLLPTPTLQQKSPAVITVYCKRHMKGECNVRNIWLSTQPTAFAISLASGWAQPWGAANVMTISTTPIPSRIFIRSSPFSQTSMKTST